MSKPSYANLAKYYPKGMSPEAVYKMIGGKVYAHYRDLPQEYENACAVRMSEACNKGGLIIHSGDSIDQGYRLRGKTIKIPLTRH